MKKLLKNRGSVLFIVMVIMSILIIAASATYYVVSANRKNVELHYGEEQSYQTALSVNDAVSGYIDTYLLSLSKSSGRLDSVPNALVSKMIGLSVNASITTTDTSLANLGLGDYKVTITKTAETVSGTANENVINKFLITTIAEVDGEKTTIRQVKTIETGPTSYFNRFFTSTGHVSTDVVFNGQDIRTTIYLENDYSRFQHGNAVKLNADLISSGTVEDDNALEYSSSVATNITIANNFYTTGGAGGTSICQGGGKVKVGGDMTTTKSVSANEVYVLGDFTISNSQSIKSGAKVYINGNCTIEAGSSTSGVTFYINGNLTMNSNSGQGVFNVGGNFYINQQWTPGTFNVCGSVIGTYGYTVNHTSVSTPWPSDEVSSTALDISNTTGRQTYEEWNAEDYFYTLFAGTPPEVKPTATGTTISSSCVYRPATCSNWGDYVVFDASASDLYILLKPENGSTNFSFNKSTSQSFNVFVTGKHAVVFILPEGVSFVSGEQSYIGHVGWALEAANKNTISQLAGSTITGKFTSKASTFASYINSDGVITGNLVSATNRTTNPYYLHNNIFLVAKNSATIDFYKGGSMFFGYIYAPRSVLKILQNDSRFVFFGGLIVGSYQFTTTASVLFTIPYDYYGLYSTKTNYNPANYIRYLMNDAGSGGGYTSSGGLKSWNTIGYK